MHRFTRILVALLALTVLLVPTLSASAAEEPVEWEAIDAAVHQEGASNLLIISGQLPDSAKLPAKVELAVPAGSEIQWAGEILGGDVSNDPSVDYKVESRDGSDIYSFTLTKARIGQIEALKPDVIVPSGDATQASLTYTPAGDVSELRLKYRLAQTAKVQQPAEGAQMDAGSARLQLLRAHRQECQGRRAADPGVHLHRRGRGTCSHDWRVHPGQQQHSRARPRPRSQHRRLGSPHHQRQSEDGAEAICRAGDACANRSCQISRRTCCRERADRRCLACCRRR